MKSRLFSPDLQACPSSRPPMPAASNQFELEVLGDMDGTVAFGWPTPSLFYTRLQGGITAQTGYAYAARLSAFVAQSLLFGFFCDVSGLKHYDILARSAFARVILSARRKFTSLVLLTGAEGISPSTQALVATLGEPIEVMTGKDAFETRLVRMAPIALQRLNPKAWVANAKPPVIDH